MATVNPDWRMPADATLRPTVRAGSDVDGPIVLTVRRGVRNEGINNEQTASVPGFLKSGHFSIRWPFGLL